MDSARLFLVVDGLFFHRAGGRKHRSLLAGNRLIERLYVGTRVAVEIFFESLRVDHLMPSVLDRLMLNRFVLDGLLLNRARRLAFPSRCGRGRCFRNAELLIPTGRSRCGLRGLVLIRPDIFVLFVQRLSDCFAGRSGKDGFVFRKSRR